jgi:hypothetical protein
VRLSARESGVLRRIDAVNNIDKALSLDDLLVRHRLFVVARGYPLGEILRQLGGGPPDPSVNVIQGNLQFQALATPAFHRWETVQEAIFNLNRFVFRIAIFDPRKPEESGDPLGLLTDPDAWRIFLLYHWEFVDEASAAPDDFRDRDGFKKRLKHGKMLPNFSDIITSLTDEVKELYPDLVLPAGWQQDTERWQKAQRLCRARLGSFIERWIHMRTVIELCQAYRSNVDPYSGHARGHYVDEGYPALIFHSPYYHDKLKEHYKDALAKDYREANGKPFVEPEMDFRERWFALMREGYLISKPFPRRFRRGYNPHRDIPSDPRNLEPFVMRTHSLMTSVPIPHPQDATKRRSAPL